MPSAKPPSESSEELKADREEKEETPLDTPVQGSTPCVTPHKAPPPSIQQPPPPPPKKQPTQPSPSTPAKANFPPLAMPITSPTSPRHEPLGQRPVGGPWTSYDGSWWLNYYYSHGGEIPTNATRLDPNHWSYSTDPAFREGQRIAYHWKGELIPVAPSRPSPSAEEKPEPSPSQESIPKPDRPPPKPSTQEPRVTNISLERKASAIVLTECAKRMRRDGSLIRLPRTNGAMAAVRTTAADARPALMMAARLHCHQSHEPSTPPRLRKAMTP